MEEALTAAGASSTHSQQMNRQFVEDRIVEMDPLPLVWNVELSGPRYSLCVKMSRLKRLAFAFEFGSVNPRQSFPKTEFPERIVKLDVSLNELQELPPEALFPFENLAELDASLNALSSVIGTGVLPSLVVLDLSYNRLRETKELGNCPHLSILHMSYNQLRTLTDIPLLNNLTQLHLSSNKLQSLEGVQNLPQLSELYVQKNRLGSLLPLASSLSLNILDASSNDVGGLPKTLHVLRGLCRLKHLALKDNPVARDNRYITAIKETTAVEILDGMFLRDPSRLSALPLCMWPFLQESASNSTNVAQAKVDLEEVARRVFGERLQQKKENVGSAVHHFHSRILEMQEELIEYEEKLRLEMEGCIR
ncbi:protein phosphatase 1 regulatory subunit 7-like isoform X1 [Elgaria multicarinata webbii]|uniref:protein phosphatase 1 regulatory subunit 7-like isoform X1 n=1 Tax=Elgaria multicarinata webbii TaxID=159646 RepID=UPI002FCD419A